jgi:3-mercaptopyruvate sulfurtransferase SseA
MSRNGPQSIAGHPIQRGAGWLRFCLGLMGLAVWLAVAINWLRPHPLPWSYQSKAERLAVGVGYSISLTEFKSLLQARAVLVLDARPKLFFEMGHVPGAWSLPREEFKVAYSRLASRLRQEGRAVVVYCESDSCEDAEAVRVALAEHGHVAKVFLGGWAEWTAAGLPEEKSP